MNPNNFNVPSGDEIRQMRLKAGLTQKQLARLADVSEGTVSHVESETHGSVTSLRNVLDGLELVYDIREKAVDDHQGQQWEEMDEELLDEDTQREAEQLVEAMDEDTEEEEPTGLGQLFPESDAPQSADD